MARYGVAWHGKVFYRGDTKQTKQLGEVRLGQAGRGFGMARPGRVWQGKARFFTLTTETNMVKLMKVAEVVLDFGLYPRQQIDSQHVTEMVAAEEAGIAFPPIVIDRKSKRCIDGFHRIRKQIRAHGEDAEIEVVEKTYRSDAAMFLDAVKYNASHGRNLSSFDRAHSILLAAKLSIDDKAIAGALSVTVDRVASLRASKSATVGKLTIPIKRTIAHKAGQKLTKSQVEANKKLGGMNQLFYVNQLITLIETDLVDLENEDLMTGLEKLQRLLEGLLVPV